MVDVQTTWLQSTLHTFQRIPRPLPPYLPTYARGLRFDNGRASRVNPLVLRGLDTLNTARPQPITATFRRPHPRVPLHVIWAYKNRQGCTPRRVGGRIAGPAAPTPPRSGRRGEKYTTPARQRSWKSGRGRGRRGGGDRGLLALPAIPPPAPGPLGR